MGPVGRQLIAVDFAVDFRCQHTLEIGSRFDHNRLTDDLCSIHINRELMREAMVKSDEIFKELRGSTTTTMQRIY